MEGGKDHCQLECVDYIGSDDVQGTQSSGASSSSAWAKNNYKVEPVDDEVALTKGKTAIAHIDELMVVWCFDDCMADTELEARIQERHLDWPPVSK